MRKGLLLVTMAALWVGGVAAAGGPWFATGVKVGEVTPNEAIVWVRLTAAPQRVGNGGGLPHVLYRNPDSGELEEQQGDRFNWIPKVILPEGGLPAALEGAAPGAPGDVRIVHAPEGGAWTFTDWFPVDPERDFTRQFTLKDLRPATAYLFKAESRAPGATEPSATVEGRFRTAPLPDQPAKVVFAVTTCHEYMHLDSPGKGFKIYPAMLALQPDFFVHTGDIVYYDKLAKTLALARWHWQRIYSLPNAIEFYRFVPSYFMKDDHDTWMNDCWPGLKSSYMGNFTFEQGQAVFLEQVPMGDRTYRTFRWGKDLQIWMVEGRDFRSPNNMPDGLEKTIWGAEQKAWFKRTVDESDAAFRVLISPTPLVGPDRKNKSDNHSNKVFKHEGDELRRFLASKKNMVVLNGDRHWQYVSADDETGLREYSCGAASDEHAGGWKQEDLMPEHEYLNVIGGFLLVTVERRDGKPVMTLQHRSVEGTILNEDVFEKITGL